MTRYHLYVDDSGTRDITPTQGPPRNDRMDCFALGGFLIDSSQVADVEARHKSLIDKWIIKAPLHSTEIRRKSKKFAWLGTHPQASDFFNDLDQFVLDSPVLGIAAVIDRPGYFRRYRAMYANGPWTLCRTAYSILLERSVKMVQHLGGDELRVFFEGCGPKEDDDIRAWHKDLRKNGMPFDSSRSSQYGAVSAQDFDRIVLASPEQKTKANALIQLADLILYPLAKSGYDPNYRPYLNLMSRCRVVDALLRPEERAARGVKYSCFDSIKQQTQ